MKCKKIIPAAFALFVLPLCAQSQFVSDEMRAELSASGGRIENVFKTNEKFVPILNPDSEFSKAATETWKKGNSKFSSENLFFVKKSELGEKANIENVSKIVRSISTMKGIEYYSNGDKKWETLYHKASVIKSPKNREVLKDDTKGNADGKSIFCLLEDNSFGDCVYRVDYRQSENEIAAFFTNAAPFKYGPITAVKTENLNINLVVTDAGDGFLVYMVVRAQYPSLPFLESRMYRSFNARVEAMFKWFKDSFAKKS